MFLKKIAIATAVSLMGTTAMAAACPDAGRVSIVGNEFPAIQTVGAGAIGLCGRRSVEVSKQT